MRIAIIKDKQVIIDNEQAELLEKIEQNKFVYSKDLTDREKILAQKLYINDILLKKKYNNCLVYIRAPKD
jgi:hypothetical protein